MSTLNRDPYEDAAEKGLVCTLPMPDELFLDIDHVEDFHVMEDMVDVLRANGVEIEEVKTTRSKSDNWHVVLRFPGRLTPIERIALQACLGSDRKREVLSFLRTRRGNAHPTVFFEKPEPEPTSGYETLLDNSDIPF